MTTPKAAVSLLVWPDGNREPWGAAGQFEYHTLHEEIFVLSGAIDFDGRYRIHALGYLNHPPFWAHPTNQTAIGDLTMLMRTYQAPIVQFQTIPSDWNKQEGFAPGEPTRCFGVTKLQLDEAPWIGLHTVSGVDTGLKAKRIWDDLDHGWTAWIMQAPPGWKSPGVFKEVPGGDEIFVVSGGLDFPRSPAQRLKSNGYVCDAQRLKDGDGSLASEEGAIFLRWTKGAEQVWREADMGGRV